MGEPCTAGKEFKICRKKDGQRTVFVPTPVLANTLASRPEEFATHSVELVARLYRSQFPACIRGLASGVSRSYSTFNTSRRYHYFRHQRKKIIKGFTTECVDAYLQPVKSWRKSVSRSCSPSGTGRERGILPPAVNEF